MTFATFKAYVWQSLRSTVFVHKSIKFQIVDDPRVVACAWLVKLVVLGYIVYALFWNFAYFSVEQPLGYSNVWAEGYSSSNGVPAGVCDGSPDYDFYYSEDWQYFDNRCRQFEYGQVIRKLEDGGIYVQTYTQDSIATYAGCTTLGSEGCAFSNSSSQNYFVPFVDDVMIYIDHGYDAFARKISGTNPQTSAFDNHDKRIRKFREESSMHFTLTELLNAAGIDSLDAYNADGAIEGSVGAPRYRMTGVTIELQISYNNLIKLNGKEIRARASVEKTPVAWTGTGSSTDITDYGGDHGEFAFKTFSSYSYGVKIVVTATGTLGRFNALYLMSIIAQFIVYLGVATIVAELVAHNFLGEKSDELYLDQLDYKHATVKSLREKKVTCDDSATVGTSGDDERVPYDSTNPPPPKSKAKSFLIAKGDAIAAAEQAI